LSPPYQNGADTEKTNPDRHRQRKRVPAGGPYNVGDGSAPAGGYGEDKRRQRNEIKDERANSENRVRYSWR